MTRDKADQVIIRSRDRVWKQWGLPSLVAYIIHRFLPGLVMSYAVTRHGCSFTKPPL
ncbi:hypothetical protein BDQ94DRAFT_144203 [Aspergillus welwitschiae]|uniref:Uncharacterized protein n=1 Tax=Aspergillus welwitschiae TaxID=1341132 RepID=A0A3F3Q149_9EURO|nr:hypothetical protein BDQ94DRAFT_144203 [Aspergillus welwitschiae]RDH32953.1 hypothetical protein BDQ94DRAFT_144203 [Aspergillus welwitschiae]